MPRALSLKPAYKEWIPAFAGMTIKGHCGLFTKPSNLIEKNESGSKASLKVAGFMVRLRT
jgi:hypothetical protein